MEFPSDILDYILSFLKPHPESIVAFSKAHPSFSRIAERHRYYSIIVHWDDSSCNSFKPSSLVKLISETPRIVNYVRVLQIECPSRRTLDVIPFLEEIASILLKFPLLECIKLTSWICALSWEHMPQSFRTAVEGCLHLPTLRMVHVGNMNFPLSLLDNVNIDCLSIFGAPDIPTSPSTHYPQLKSLDLTGHNNHQSFNSWAKRRIVNLQSLKYDYSSHETILELFDICSDTLSHLDVDMEDAYTVYDLDDGIMEQHDTAAVDLSFLRNLQHLIVRASVTFDEGEPDESVQCISSLPAAVDIIKTTSSPQHLTLEIAISFFKEPLDELDFLPFTALAASFASSQRIDLYISLFYSRSFTHSEIVSWLAGYKGFMELIERGVLVIHVDEAAPKFLDKYA